LLKTKLTIIRRAGNTQITNVRCSIFKCFFKYLPTGTCKLFLLIMILFNLLLLNLVF